MKNVLRVAVWVILGFAFLGCQSIASESTDDIIVQSSARVAVANPTEDKSGDFFLLRSMLCRKAFSEALTNLVVQTGQSEDALRGATICEIDEEFENGVYSLKLDVVWSKTREDAAVRILTETNVTEAPFDVPTEDEARTLTSWIGPKQSLDSEGAIRFLGFSAMAIGRNTVLSRQNIRRAELDAQSMAVRAFMGKDRKMTDVKAVFRPVFRQRSHHPLCPDRDMFVCGYEVVSLELPAK